MKEITIQSITSIQPLPLPPATPNTGTNNISFSDVLTRSIDTVNSKREEAANLRAGLISGEHARIHETMIALEKASISFKLMTKIQSKAITAYREVMRMQI